MEKTDKIYCFIQYPILESIDRKDILADALSLGRIFFDPLYLEYEQQMRPYSLDAQRLLLDSLPDEKNFTVRIHDQWSESVFQQYDEVIFERHYFTREQFETKQAILLDYMKIKMKHARFGYIRSYDEFLYHNIEKLDYRKIIEEDQETHRHPKKKNAQGEVIVDGHYFAGFDVFHFGFCFTSCWRMYFSKDYGSILPINLLRGVQQVEKVEEIQEQTLMIELYKDPYSWDKESNLKFQRLFRDQIGVDQLSWSNGVGVLREPLIEYRMLFNSLQIIQYQNDFLQPVPKSQATYFVTRTYDLKTKTETLQQVKGSLNAQAYFPLINDRKRKMKTIVTLTLDQTIDDGLSAYEFYIRNYLELNIKDKKYERYKPILTFHLSEDDFLSIPIQSLKSRMKDILFSEEKRAEKKRAFYVSKGKNHLYVEFLPLNLIVTKNENGQT
ncbi:hypothetical protein [Enterococcus olivae]